MSRMKYIVTINDNGNEEIFVFNEIINHDCMAEVLGYIKNQSFGDWERVRREPISAGFVQDGVCYGRSVTLGLSSREGIDTKLLAIGGIK